MAEFIATAAILAKGAGVAIQIQLQAEAAWSVVPGVHELRRGQGDGLHGQGPGRPSENT